MRTFLKLAVVAALGFSPSANAAVTYLDFEGIAPYPNASDVLIQSYYDGGTASNGNSGPNLGVEFTSTAVLLCLNTAGTACSNTSRGGFGIPTSAFGALFFPDANPTMNVAAGFDTGFSFTYSAPYATGTSVSVFSDINGGGSLLATSVLPLTANNGCDIAISNGANYCPFGNFSLVFSGTAKSVVFGGSSNSQVFDDLTFGSATPGGGTVPEPAAWALMIAGFGLVGTSLRRRRMADAVA